VAQTTNRQSIFDLLRARDGQWVSRADIDFVGGHDAGRRMRELEAELGSSGQWRLESRESEGRLLEYRLVALAPDPAAQRERQRWVCTKCDSFPYSSENLQPTMDPRYKMGRCPRCKGKTPSIFKMLHPVPKGEAEAHL